MRKVLILSIALLMLLGGLGSIAISGVAISGVTLAILGGGASPTATLNDQFTDDTTGWATRSGMTSCTHSGSTLQANGQGECHYSGSDDGVQPTDKKQWAILRWDTQSEHKGVFLRAISGTTNPTNSEYQYAVRCSAAAFHIRICDSGDVCSTIANVNGGGTCDDEGGDWIALMVAGQGDSTELCAWWFDTLSPPSTSTDPTDWGFADYCVMANTPISLLSEFVDGGTTEVGWGASLGPDDLKGFPVDGQVDTGIYAGTGNTDGIKQFIAGDLGL